MRLCEARLTVAAVPFKWWRSSLGGRKLASEVRIGEAMQVAAHVEWAAKRLPFESKCLPRAMALSWMLRRRGIAHVVVFAVRPADKRGLDDDLHAWVEAGGSTILGELPGPWVETLRLGA